MTAQEFHQSHEDTHNELTLSKYKPGKPNSSWYYAMALSKLVEGGSWSRQQAEDWVRDKVTPPDHRKDFPIV